MTMAELILGNMMTGICARHPEMPEAQLLALPGGSLEILGTLGMAENIVNDLTIAGTPYRLIWSLEGCPRTRTCHKTTALTNATCHPLDIKG